MSAHSWLANQRETRLVLEEYGLTTKHRLGQNFLVNDTVIGRILELSELSDSDVVFEVGPGIGTLIVTAAQQRDFPVVQYGVLLISICVTFINLLVDISYGLLDPRIRDSYQ